MTIVASQIVRAVPSVLSAGGTPVSTQGLFLTQGQRVPSGQVLSFPTALAVSAYFGLSSPEYAAAQIYFAGFTGCTILPPSLLFASYPAVATPAWLRGASVAAVTLPALKAMAGTLSLTVNGTIVTSSAINLSAAVSFSSAATLVQAAFSSPPFAVTFDSVASAFVFTAASTGAASTVTAASGTLAAGLGLTAASGAVTSQGAAAAVPGAFMSALLLVTQNFLSWTHLFDPDAGSGNALKFAFAQWNGQQGNQYLYVPWDSDVTPALSNAAATSLGGLVNAAAISGVMPVWGPDFTIAAFACAIGAAIDWTRLNGRLTYDFKSQSGLATPVTDPVTAANLIANGYNFYGAYALASNGWNFLTPGSVSGPYKWADSYVNQVWMNNAIELSMMTLLTTALSIPYNQAGYAMVSASILVPVTAAVNFGAIRPGVPPSALEAAQMNNIAGVDVATTVGTRGWYLQITPAPAQTRALRQSPSMSLFYMDGSSIQQLIIASVMVQ